MGYAQMNEEDGRRAPKRRYPPFWERFVPIALGIILVIIVALLLIAISVALGLFPRVSQSIQSLARVLPGMCCAPLL